MNNKINIYKALFYSKVPAHEKYYYLKKKNDIEMQLQEKLALLMEDARIKDRKYSKPAATTRKVQTTESSIESGGDGRARILSPRQKKSLANLNRKRTSARNSGFLKSSDR